MTDKVKSEITSKINDYADIVLKNMDKERTPISRQLDALKPEMEKLSKEYQIDISDIFIIYMDSASTVLNNIPRNLDNIEDYNEFDEFNEVER